MSIDTPNLDDLSYQQLIDTLVQSIPQYSEQWTDYNASDPGIVLLEMLSWVAQSLLYRGNIISDTSYQNYLRLVAGEEPLRPVDELQLTLLETLKNWPEQQSNQDIMEVTSQAQLYWQCSNRAISETDFYGLSLTAYYDELAVQMGGQVSSINYRQQSLEHLQQLRRIFVQTENENKLLTSLKHVTIIVNTTDNPNDSLYINSDQNEIFTPDTAAIVFAINNYLVPRRPVSTLLTVRPVALTDIDIQVDIIYASSSDTSQTIKNVQQTISDYVNPFIGGHEGEGWPLGNSLVSSDLVRLVGELDDVTAVTGVWLKKYIQIYASTSALPIEHFPDGLYQIYYQQPETPDTKKQPAKKSVAEGPQTSTDEKVSPGKDSDNKDVPIDMPWKIILNQEKLDSIIQQLTNVPDIYQKEAKQWQQILLNHTAQKTSQTIVTTIELKVQRMQEYSEKIIELNKAIAKLDAQISAQSKPLPQTDVNSNASTDVDTNLNTNLSATDGEVQETNTSDNKVPTAKNIPFDFLQIKELIGTVNATVPSPVLTGVQK